MASHGRGSYIGGRVHLVIKKTCHQDLSLCTHSTQHTPGAARQSTQDSNPVWIKPSMCPTPRSIFRNRVFRIPKEVKKH